MDQASYIDKLRKDIIFQTNLRQFDLNFSTTWGLFSPREIDEGTQLLLKHIEIKDTDDCFDLGCGYGPIGITMAKLAPKGTTLMIDKDFLAIQYANNNININKLGNCSAKLSNAFEHIEAQTFDIICSNIPAKVGKELLQIIIYDAYQRLNSGGSFYVVTINGLRHFMKRHFTEVFGNYDKIKQGKSYTVAKATK